MIICSIIILTFNAKEILHECLEPLAILDKHCYEVILVDNGSTDGTSGYIKLRYPWVKVVTLRRNLGYAEGNNIGARYAKGKYLLFMNNDVSITHESIESLITFMEHNPRIGVVSPKIFSDKEVLDAAGGEVTYPLGFAPRRGRGRKDSNKFINPELVAYAPGSLFLIRKDLFYSLGGFDPTYFCYHEEVDLCWRARLIGYIIAFYPHATAFHRVSYTTSKFSVDQAYFMRRNRLVTNLKNYGASNLLVWLTIELLFASSLAVSGIVSATLRAYNAKYFRAVIDVLKNIRKIIEQRRVVQSTRLVSDRQALQYHTRKLIP
jgi:GT2 family glycosyltransferase